MAVKWANDAMMDAALAYVAAATEMRVCIVLDATPTRAEAVAAALTGSTAPTFQAASDGVTNGRKIVVDAKSGISVTGNGSAEQVALSDATNLRYVTSCTAQTLASGNTVNIPAWNIEVADPA